MPEDTLVKQALNLLSGDEHTQIGLAEYGEISAFFFEHGKLPRKSKIGNN